MPVPLKAPLDSGPDPTEDHHVELVFGISRAAGTPATDATEQLRNTLTNHGYDVSTIKVSQLLEDSLLAQGRDLSSLRPDRRTAALIAEGNSLCTQAESRAELARRVIATIKDERTTRSAGNQTSRSTRRAFIVDSLKRPEEVTLLRAVYGDHFVLVGFVATEETKSDTLYELFEPHVTTPGTDARAIAAALIQTDLSDGSAFGQNILGTLYLSDVFIDVDPGKDDRQQVRRFLGLLFGDPGAEAPTTDEYAMQLATQSAALSPELGLRVGAAIMNATGDVVATGYNRHPTISDPPAFDAGALDIRRLVRDTLDSLSKDATTLTGTARSQLENDGDAWVDDLLEGPLKSSQLRSLTEYQRPVHAEMNAVISAARQQVALTECTMYVTAYPCHNCTKHLIALGIRVVFLEPYAKSRATSMYGTNVDFTVFSGVAPRRYAPVFLYRRNPDRKDHRGVGLSWNDEDRHHASPQVTIHITQRSKVDREDWVLSSPVAGS